MFFNGVPVPVFFYHLLFRWVYRPKGGNINISGEIMAVDVKKPASFRLYRFEIAVFEDIYQARAVVVGGGFIGLERD